MITIIFNMIPDAVNDCQQFFVDQFIIADGVKFSAALDPPISPTAIIVSPVDQHIVRDFLRPFRGFEFHGMTNIDGTEVKT